MTNIRYYLLIIFCTIHSIVWAGDNITSLEIALQHFVEQHHKQIGIAVIINGTDTISINNSTQYPMMSVFKLHQAIAIAHTLDQQGISLDSILRIKRNEIKENTYSPMRNDYPTGDLSIPIRDLLQYTLLLSDNNACDILFDRILGVEATNDYIHSLGISDCAIAATEQDMHNQPEYCYSNWSSPLATAQLIDLLLTHQAGTGKYQPFIIQTMLKCNTGTNRIPGFTHPENVRIGHKTGTGGTNALGETTGINDVGFVLLPNKQRYVLTVFIKDAQGPISENERIISAISEMVYTFVCTPNQ